MAVGLVVGGEAEDAQAPAEQVGLHGEGGDDLGLVVGLAEGAGIASAVVVDLPAGGLGVGEPDGGVEAEGALPGFGLEGDLDLGLGGVEVERVEKAVVGGSALRAGGLVGAGGMEEREDVDGLVGAEGEGGLAEGLLELPALGEGAVGGGDAAEGEGRGGDGWIPGLGGGGRGRLGGIGRRGRGGVRAGGIGEAVVAGEALGVREGAAGGQGGGQGGGAREKEKDSERERAAEHGEGGRR